MGKSNKKTQIRFDDDYENNDWHDDFDKNWKKEDEQRHRKRLAKYETLEEANDTRN